jgi:hypothetical protein
VVSFLNIHVILMIEAYCIQYLRVIFEFYIIFYFSFFERVRHWIATQGHTQDWANPMRYGVKVTASSTEKGVPAEILELKPAECWTKYPERYREKEGHGEGERRREGRGRGGGERGRGEGCFQT